MNLYKLLIFITLFFIGHSGVGHGKDISLFRKNGKTAFNYSHLIKEENLASGDRIFVAPGKYFIYIQKLGEGNQTQVFEVMREGDPKRYALRLPLKNDFRSLKQNREAMNDFLFGYEILKEEKVSIPEIIESKESSYILVEKVEDSFDLEKFIFYSDEISAKELKEAELALEVLINELAPFSHVGDAHRKQFVYDRNKKKWIFLDWGKQHRLSSEFQDSVGVALGKLFNPPGLKDPPLEKPFRNMDQDFKRRLRISNRWEEVHKSELQNIKQKELIFLEDHFNKFNSSMKAKEILDFYQKAKKAPFTEVTYKFIFDHFLKNQQEILRLIPANGLYIFSLANTIINSHDQLSDFMGLVVPKLETLEEVLDFSQYLRGERRLYNLYDDSDYYRFHRAISDRIDILLDDPMQATPSKKVLKRLLKDEWVRGLVREKIKKLKRPIMTKTYKCTKSMLRALLSLRIE